MERDAYGLFGFKTINCSHFTNTIAVERLNYRLFVYTAAVERLNSEVYMNLAQLLIISILY